MSIFKITEKAFGLDISDHSIRLVQLSQNRKRVSLQLYNEIQLPDNCIVEGEIKQAKTFLNALKKLIKTHQGQGQLSNEVIGVLPEPKTYLKTIQLAKANQEETEQELIKLIPQHFPVDLANSYFDWQLIHSNEQIQTVVVGLCPKKITDSYVELISEAGLIPSVLEIEAAAIARALLNQESLLKKKKRTIKTRNPKENIINNLPIEAKEIKLGPKIIADIGANHTGLFVYDEDNIQFTLSAPISGTKINNLIVKGLNLDPQKAEKIKIACGLDKSKCEGALLEIVADVITELEQSIIKAIAFYRQNFSTEKEITQIILCGGGANLINITDTLEQRLKIKTTTSNPWHQIANPDPKYFTNNKSQSFVTAIGLALRGLNPKNFL